MPETSRAAEVLTIDRLKAPTAQTKVVAEEANEFVFAVVGRIGSGTSWVAESFRELLARGLAQPFETKILKATEVIEAWAIANNKGTPDRNAARTIETATSWQDLGDEMRAKDSAAVATALIGK